MELLSGSISIIDKTRHDFEEAFKNKLVNDCFRNIVTASIPLKDGEKAKIDNPEFKEKFSAILSPVSQNLVSEFKHVGQFDTGNLFTSMVTSISDSVSLEADYRSNKIKNEIILGRVNQRDPLAFHKYVSEEFANIASFESNDVKRAFLRDMKYVMATEGANDVVERIKNDVKDAIEETEAKNNLVEGTTQEIVDYKNEMAPPDDQYQDPNAPQSADPGAADPNNPDVAADPGMIADTSDDGMAAGGDQGGEPGADPDPNGEGQIYDQSGGTDDLGSGPTSTGDQQMDAQAAAGGDPNAAMDGNADPGMGDPNDPNAAGGDPNDPNAAMDGNADPGMGDPNDPNAAAGGDPNDPLAMGNEDPNAAGADPNMAAGGAAAPSDDTGGDGSNSNQNSGGITININGIDLKKAKENCNLFNAESLARERIPLHPLAFDDMEIPDVESFSAECANAVGNVREEMDIRLDALRLAIKQNNMISQEQSNALYAKADELEQVVDESISRSMEYGKILNKIGLSTQGITRRGEDSMICARNIINRFLTHTQFVSPEVRPYTSKENVFANAFDIVQLRQHCMKQRVPNQMQVNDLVSRENVFYHNMVNFNDEAVKKEASAVIDLSRLNFQKAMSPNFITDYRIKTWEDNLGADYNHDVNEKVVKRVKEKFEHLWGRPLNENEESIVRATTNQEDVTEIIPTPYEKFLITMSKEAINAHKFEDPEKGVSLTNEEKKNIEWKSRLMTTVYKSMEAFGLINANERRSFDKFVSLVRM